MRINLPDSLMVHVIGVLEAEQGESAADFVVKATELAIGVRLGLAILSSNKVQIASLVDTVALGVLSFREGEDTLVACREKVCQGLFGMSTLQSATWVRGHFGNDGSGAIL